MDGWNNSWRAANDHRKSCLFGLRFLMICDHGSFRRRLLASSAAMAVFSITTQSHKSNEETRPCSDTKCQHDLAQWEGTLGKLLNLVGRKFWKCTSLLDRYNQNVNMTYYKNPKRVEKAKVYYIHYITCSSTCEVSGSHCPSVDSGVW